MWLLIYMTWRLTLYHYIGLVGGTFLYQKSGNQLKTGLVLFQYHLRLEPNAVCAKILVDDISTTMDAKVNIFLGRFHLSSSFSFTSLKLIKNVFWIASTGRLWKSDNFKGLKMSAFSLHSQSLFSIWSWGRLFLQMKMLRPVRRKMLYIYLSSPQLKQSQYNNICSSLQQQLHASGPVRSKPSTCYIHNQICAHSPSNYWEGPIFL